MFLLSSCSLDNSLSKKALDQGELALANREYESALDSFKLAKKEGLKSRETDEIISILDTYLKSLEFFEEDEFYQASRTIGKINENYKNYDMKPDIDELIEAIEERKLEQESDHAAGLIEIKLSKMDIEEAERLVAAYVSKDPNMTLEEFNDEFEGIEYESIVMEEGTNEPWYWINIYQKTGNFRISNYFIHPESKEIRNFIMTKD